MASLTNDALYGAYRSPTLGADMLNPAAEDETDWGAVLSGGIVGAAQGAIGAMVGGAYADGQLRTPQAQAALRQQQQQQSMTMLLVLGAIAFAVMH